MLITFQLLVQHVLLFTTSARFVEKTFDKEWLDEGQTLQQPGKYSLKSDDDEDASDIRDFFIDYIKGRLL